MRLARITFLLAGALIASCEDSEPTPATEVLVTVDSDLDVPADIDVVRIRIDSAATQTEVDHHDFPLAIDEPTADQVQFPFSLGIAKAGESAFLLRVIGLKGGEPVVQLDWNVSFEDRTTLGVSPFLGENCARARCGSGQTCFPRKRGSVAAGACAAFPAAETTPVRSGAP